MPTNTKGHPGPTATATPSSVAQALIDLGNLRPPAPPRNEGVERGRDFGHVAKRYMRRYDRDGGDIGPKYVFGRVVNSSSGTFAEGAK